MKEINLYKIGTDFVSIIEEQLEESYTKCHLDSYDMTANYYIFTYKLDLFNYFYFVKDKAGAPGFTTKSLLETLENNKILNNEYISTKLKNLGMLDMSYIKLKIKKNNLTNLLTLYKMQGVI